MENVLILKQMLLDWINTIKEPRCIILNNLHELKSGIVFIDIVKAYLKKNKLEKEFFFKLLSCEKMNTYNRFIILFNILSNFCNIDDFNFDEIIQYNVRIFIYLMLKG